MSEAPSPTSRPEPPVGAERWSDWQLAAGLVAGFLALDHLTKWLAIRHLKPGWWDTMEPDFVMWAERPRIVLIPNFLQLAYAENKGAAFSILYGHTFLLGVISAIATGLLFWFWQSLPARERLGRLACALILSGAIGNMIDRFARGYVVDFIDAHWLHRAHWPTFNIADSCICIGAGLLMMQFLRGRI